MNRGVRFFDRPYTLAIAVVSATALIGLICNLPFRYVEIGIQEHSAFDVAKSTQVEQSVANVIAGYPAEISRKLYLRDPENDAGSMMSFEGELLSRRFSGAAIAINALFWTAIAALILAVLYRPRPRGRSGVWQRLDEAVLPTLILAVPLTWIGFHQWRLHRQQRLVSQIVQSGTCDLATFTPSWAADLLPEKLVDYLGRVRSATVYRPSHDLLVSLMEQPMLHHLRIVNRQPPGMSMDEFSAAPRIIASPTTEPPHYFSTDANLVSSEVDQNAAAATAKTEDATTAAAKPSADAVVKPWWEEGSARPIQLYVDSGIGPFAADQMLSSHRQIVRLSLVNFKLSADEVRAIERLTHLRRLSLRRCRMPATGIQDPSWRSTIETLTLTTGNYREENIHLDQFARLKNLSLMQAGPWRSPGCTNINIADADELQNVSLDILRRFELHVDNAPVLKELDASNPNDVLEGQVISMSRINDFRRLAIKNCPSLCELHLIVSKLREMDIDESGGISDLEVSSFRVGRFGGSVRQPLQYLDTAEILDEVGRCELVQNLEMTGLDLRGQDISRLTSGPLLESLSLASSDLDPQQVETLLASDSLQKLDFGDLKLSQKRFEDTTRRFPNLRSLMCDASGLRQLVLDETSKLTDLRSLPLSSIDRLICKRGCQLSCDLNINHPLDELRIDDPSRLIGLAIGQSFPSNATLGRFRDLKYFVGGGPEVDDELFEKLRWCNGLQHLMIAHGDLSRRSLETLNGMRSLRSLSLPGADLDDTVIARWNNLTDLWNLDLSETNVDAAAMLWMAQNNSLRFLALDRMSLSQDAARELSRLRQLSHLSLRETPLDPTQVKRICSMPLDYLNLSGTTMTDDHIEAIAASKRPRVLVIRDCGVTPQQLRTLLADRPEMAIEVEPDLYQDPAVANLDQSGRNLVHSASIHSQQEIRLQGRLVVSVGQDAIDRDQEATTHNDSSVPRSNDVATDLETPMDPERQSDNDAIALSVVRYASGANGDDVEANDDGGQIDGDTIGDPLSDQMHMRRPLVRRGPNRPPPSRRGPPETAPTRLADDDDDSELGDELPRRRLTIFRYLPAASDSLFLTIEKRPVDDVIAPPLAYFPPTDWVTGKADHFRSPQPSAAMVEPAAGLDR